MKISYNWLKWYVPAVPEVNALAEAIVFHAFEVESVEPFGDDFILDIKTLPDRNHDCLSHLGIAKEVSTILNISFNDPTSQYKIPESKPTNLKIDIQTPNCRRYMGRIVRNVKVGPSPEWIVKHLESIGQRSINNIVDATNLTMFNCGQPCHAFDLGKLKDGIIVRNANVGEKITLLTGEEKELNDSMMVISDNGGNALAVAGVKGGKHAEVNKDTTDILIEVANFDAVSVRKTAKVLNIQTDSTKRFENDLSPELASYAMRELSALLVEMFPEAIFEEVVDIYPKPQEVKNISVTAQYINKKLGSSFSTEEMEDVWKRLKFEYKKNGDEFVIKSPAMRLDLLEPHDLVEEIGRIIGYDKVTPELPKLDFKPQVNDVYSKIMAAKNYFVDQGYSEVMTYTFRNKGEVQVLKSASDKKFLRTNLKDGLEESLKLNTLNAPILGLKEVKIFEVGTVFLKDKEEIHVAYNEKKNIIEKSLDVFIQEKLSSEEHGYFSTEKFLVLAPSRSQDSSKEAFPLGKFKMWSLYPFISRDIAFWAQEGTNIEEVKSLIKENAGELLVKGPDIFDEFKKEGRISYAFRLVFQSFERTLTDEEVSVFMQKISAKLLEKGFEIR